MAESYSVCMLCSNDAETVSASVESVIGLSKFRSIDVVVVDNMSRDGSQEVLRRLAQEGKIKLIEQKCSRGKGRQLAFEASRGDYVLGHMDCDDVFDAEGLDYLLGIYHTRFKGMLVMTMKRGSDEASNITIAPRPLLEELGGWRDLNWGEDWDLWARASGMSKYTYLPYPYETPPHRSIKVRYGIFREPTSRFGMRRSKYADAIKSGRSMFRAGEHVSISQKLTYYLAKANVALRRNYLYPVPDPNFSEFPKT
jgi:glycosyltransferase involved in cell wall biosynthesis